jgi:hypothetical protein
VPTKESFLPQSKKQQQPWIDPSSSSDEDDIDILIDHNNDNNNVDNNRPRKQLKPPTSYVGFRLKNNTNHNSPDNTDSMSVGAGTFMSEITMLNLDFVPDGESLGSNDDKKNEEEDEEFQVDLYPSSRHDNSNNNGMDQIKAMEQMILQSKTEIDDQQSTYLMDSSRKSLLSMGASSLGNISFGISSVFGHKKRMMMQNNNGAGDNGGMNYYPKRNTSGEENKDSNNKNTNTKGASYLDDNDDSTCGYSSVGDGMTAMQQLMQFANNTKRGGGTDDGLDGSRRSLVSVDTSGNMSFGVNSVVAHRARIGGGGGGDSGRDDEYDEFMMKLKRNSSLKPAAKKSAALTAAATATEAKYRQGEDEHTEDNGIHQIMAMEQMILGSRTELDDQQSVFLTDQLGRGHSRSNSFASLASGGNISLGVSSIFAHKKRMGDVNGKKKCDDGSESTDDEEFILASLVSTKNVDNKAAPSPPPSQQQPSSNTPHRRLSADHAYNDQEIDAIIELKLEIANQRTIIDDLSSKLNRVTSEKKELEEKSQQHSRQLSSSTAAIDGSLRQLSMSASSILSSFKAQLMEEAPTPNNTTATTTTTSSSWRLEKLGEDGKRLSSFNSRDSTAPVNNNKTLEQQIHELQSSLRAQMESSAHKERLYKLQLQELHAENKELYEENQRLRNQYVVKTKTI